MTRTQNRSHIETPIARRGFLKTAAALGGAVVTSQLAAQSSGTIMAYIGAYTDRGKGIHMFTVNPNDGALTPVNILTGLPSPSSLYVHPNRKFLYAGNEISNFTGANTSGSVTAISIDPANGDLKILNAISSGGLGPAHVSVDPTGKFVFAANYGSGQVGVLSLKDDGSLDALVDTKKITGPLGKNPAADAPPGSFANSGHDAPHAHMAQMDPFGRYLLVTDLGTDRTYVFTMAPSGLLTPNVPEFIQASNGAGPRHFAFHATGRFLYVLNEESSTLDVMSWDAGTGQATIQQSFSTLPKGYAGTNYASEITATPDGRFVYCANRLCDSVAVFATDAATGSARMIDVVWTRGSYPRNFAIEPGGNFLYVLHSRSDNVTTFQVNRTTGSLTFVDKWTPVGNPSEIRFVRL
ncbi:MAG: lactonase family protein [Acidobacteriota bacterium]